MRACIVRYRNEVHSYRAVLYKQEFLGGKLQPFETVDIWFRDDPYSVLMRWRSDSVGKADRVLYVRGANDDKMLARPKNRAARILVGDVVSRDTDSADAKGGGRVSLREFGLCKGTERALASWEAAKNRGNLFVDYLGQERVVECDNRLAFHFRRICNPPEEDGTATADLSFDVETWLQTASVMTDRDGRRVAAYYFREVVLNPELVGGDAAMT